MAMTATGGGAAGSRFEPGRPAGLTDDEWRVVCLWRAGAVVSEVGRVPAPVPALVLPADFPVAEIPLLAAAARERVRHLAEEGQARREEEAPPGDLARAAAAYVAVAVDRSPADFLASHLWPWPAVAAGWAVGTGAEGAEPRTQALAYLRRLGGMDRLVTGIALALAEGGAMLRDDGAAP